MDAFTTYLLLFWEYFKIGLFTIGGGYAMLPLVTKAVVKNGWMAEADLINFVGIAESTPGPFAINLATFVGHTVGSEYGVWGAILGSVVATVAVVLPSLIIIMIVTVLFQKFKQSKLVQGVLTGVKPVVVGLILSAVVSVASAVVLPNLNLNAITAEGFSQFNWVSLVIVAIFLPLSQIKIKKKKIHPIFLILLSAVIGVVVFGVFKVQQ